MKYSLFLLPNLKNEYWLDVTDEHNLCSDINIFIGKQEKLPATAYICVFNYGDWKPIFWGRINNNRQVIFKNMGRNVLYRIALQDGEGIRFIGNTFLIDSAGTTKYPAADFNNTQTMHLHKLNTGSEMWVKKGIAYTLQVMDTINQWKTLSEQVCPKDSIISFSKVPSNGLYRLIKRDGAKQLERIFTYEKNKQIWW